MGSRDRTIVIRMFKTSLGYRFQTTKNKIKALIVKALRRVFEKVPQSIFIIIVLLINLLINFLFLRWGSHVTLAGLELGLYLSS